MSPQNPAIDPRRTALLIMDYQPVVGGDPALRVRTQIQWRTTR